MEYGEGFFRTYIAVKRHHDHNNSYKGKHSIWWIGFRGLVHCHHGWTCWSASRYGAGKGGESSTSCRPQEVNRHWAWLEHLRLQTPLHSDKLPPTRPHPLQQSNWCCVGVDIIPIRLTVDISQFRKH